MPTDSLTEFNALYPDFIEFVKNHEIPPKIHEKLTFLANRILNKPMENNYQQVEQQELDQLSQLDLPGKVALFLSVTKCIMGKVSVDFEGNRKAFIKKEGLFSFWRPCYITFDSQNLIITKKRTPMPFPFKSLQISKNVKEQGRKHFFMIGKTGSTKYFIGLEEARLAHELFAKIRQLIVSKIALKSKVIASTVDTPSEKEIDMSAVLHQESISRKEQELAAAMIQEFQLDEVEDELQYQIEENMENGRIVRHVTNRSLFKVLIMLQYQNPERIFDLYAQSKEWNIEIQECKLISKVDQNTYIAYEKHKPYSFTSYARDFVVMKKAAEIKGKYYLMEKSIEHRDYPPARGVVRANLKNRVTALLPHPTNNKLLLLVSRIDVDYGGYNRVQDNINMLLRFMRVYNLFPKYCLQKSFGQEIQQLFNFSHDHTKTIIVQNRDRNNSQDLAELINFHKNNAVSSSSSKKVVDKKSLRDFLQRYVQDPINEGIIDRIRQLEHHSYHILHKYQFSPKQDQGLRHKDDSLPQEDFVIQNGDWVINQSQEMVFVNQRVIDSQKDVIKYIFKQISSNFLSGKSIMNMSLPVDIFDKRSILERTAQSFGFAPIFLKQAGKTDNQIEQVAYLMTFMLAITLLELRIQKPFNPILGETFQGYLGGIPIYMQQISHHPPISAYYMTCPEFTLYGNVYSVADMGINSCVGYNGGLYNIILHKNNAHYQCQMASGEVSGLMFGDRKLKPCAKAFVMNRKSNLFAECAFGKQKADVYPMGKPLGPSELAGGVFKVTPEFTTKFMNEKKKWVYSGLTKKDVVQKLGLIEGLWNGKITICGKTTKKSRYDPLPFQLQYEEFPLASNSNYREDILYKRMGNLGQSQTTKEAMENIQRNDRKLRGNRH